MPAQICRAAENKELNRLQECTKNVPRFEVFYDGSFGSQLLFAVRCKTLSVNRRTWRWNEGNTMLCLQCNRGVEETVEHLVLECSKYEQERE
ncbi:hypothetical protein FHG87_025279, partial [Trinorchestia longiramus]